jgi:hypothetical protein
VALIVLEDSWSRMNPSLPADFDQMSAETQEIILRAAAWGGVKALKQAKSLAVGLKAANG